MTNKKASKATKSGVQNKVRGENFKYRLGLDVGTNSLGWAVIEVDDKGKPKKVRDAGVRIFSDGYDSDTSDATLKSHRTDARAARRRRDRFKQRQSLLSNQLKKAKLFPEDKSEQKELQRKNPLELRAKALTEELEPYEISRILLHLNQRRGFKSNRKDTDTAEVGMVSDSVRELLKAMGLKKYKDKEEAIDELRGQPNLTYGSFLWEKRKNNKKEILSTRAKPTEDGKLYEVYPTREIYEDEFEKIWNAQKEYSPELTDSAYKKIKSIIFYQRPLKPQVRGKCSFFPDEDRTFRMLPSFQRYQIYQTVGNINWLEGNSKRKWLCTDKKDKSDKELEDTLKEARDIVVDLLEQPKADGTVIVKKVKDSLIKSDIIDGNIQLNFELSGEKYFQGNLTSRIMSQESHVGEQWFKWGVEKQDDFIELLIGEKKSVEKTDKNEELDDVEVIDIIKNDYKLTEAQVLNCLSDFAKLPKGTANISLKAARYLLEKMQSKYISQYGATQELKAELGEEEQAGEILASLPYYGKYFVENFLGGGYIIPGTGNKEDSDDLKFYGGVTNPTVHISLNQIRKVVNELINKRYGYPNSIAIELARDLPITKAARRELKALQDKNREENKKIKNILRDKHGIKSAAKEDIDKYKLWKQQKGFCPYSGKRIGASEIFSAKFEIDHIIPRSVYADDSLANKVLCTREANRYKKNQTPYEAFKNSSNGYNWDEILKRAEDIKYSKIVPRKKRGSSKRKYEKRDFSKARKFYPDALEKLKEEGEFPDRHLNDTRYIGKLAKAYLSGICEDGKIDVITGQQTFDLRNEWGLNEVLQKLSKNKTNKSVKKSRVKNRDDHRHHAIDAIVVGLTTRSMLAGFAKAARKGEELRSRRFLEGFSIPYATFNKDVETIVDSIIVSHRVKKKTLPRSLEKDERGKFLYSVTDGQLHNETAYNITFNPDEIIEAFSEEQKKLFKGLVWKPNNNLNVLKNEIDGILNEKLREQFSAALKSGGYDAVKKMAKEKGLPYYVMEGKMGLYQVVWRREIGWFDTIKKIETIRDINLRKKIMQVYKKKKIDGVIKFANSQNPKIKKVRYLQNSTVIPMRDNGGKIYKAYEPDNNWGVEIYEYPEGHHMAGKWEGVIVRSFFANKFDFQPGETFKPHPAAKLIMYLSKNDCIEVDGEDGKRIIWKVQSTTQMGAYQYVQIASLNKAMIEKMEIRSVKQLQELNAKKVHISPTGLVSYENRKSRKKRKR